MRFSVYRNVSEKTCTSIFCYEYRSLLTRRMWCVAHKCSFGGDLSIEEMAEFTKKIAQNCDAAVVITCHLDPDNEGDEVWKSNCQKFLDLTPG